MEHCCSDGNNDGTAALDERAPDPQLLARWPGGYPGAECGLRQHRSRLADRDEERGEEVRDSDLGEKPGENRLAGHQLVADSLQRIGPREKAGRTSFIVWD